MAETPGTPDPTSTRISRTADGHAAGTVQEPRRRSDRVPRRFWVGLVACAVYVAIAAGVGNALLVAADTDDAIANFAISHLITLPVLVGAGIWFARTSGWWRDVWTVPAPWQTRPRRWWLLAFPAVILVQEIATLATSPWASARAADLLIVALGVALVGLGEELYFRGILRVAIRGRHGEFLALMGTSLLFGLAHALSGFLHGEPLGAVAFAVADTAMFGAAYYGAFLATGRLWVAVALHALGDFSLFVQGGDTDPASAADPDPVTVGTMFVLIPLTIVLIISTIRADVRARRGRSAARE